jgi:quercetin dioxygenase-like cupin family protein
LIPPIIADTGGLLRALARTPAGQPSFPEYERILISAAAKRRGPSHSNDSRGRSAARLPARGAESPPAKCPGGTDTGGAPGDRNCIFFGVDLCRSGSKAEPTCWDRQDTNPVRTWQASAGARREMGPSMNTKSDQHDREHLDLVFLYALKALPASEIPVAENYIRSCADCRREIESLRPIVDSLVFWPTDIQRPSVSLWARLARRISEETGKSPVFPTFESQAEPEWREVAPGISCQILAADTENDRVTMLVRLDPGTDYPPHRHAGTEELHLLHGELWIDDRKLYPGDYNRAEAGSVDHRVWSETGCTCVLVTSPSDVIL